jgi:hypothetical protein
MVCFRYIIVRKYTAQGDNKDDNNNNNIVDNIACVKRYTLRVFWGARGGVVVEALRYKLEGRGFDLAASVV